VDEKTHSAIFSEQQDFEHEDVGESEMSVEEAAIPIDQLIPFPHEHHMTLGQELIHIFSPDIIFVFDVGAGELMKAALSQRVLAVGVVRNSAHKMMVMGILKDYVKGLNLVNFGEGAPAKPSALVSFEQDWATSSTAGWSADTAETTPQKRKADNNLI